MAVAAAVDGAGNPGKTTIAGMGSARAGVITGIGTGNIAFRACRH